MKERIISILKSTGKILIVVSVVLNITTIGPTLLPTSHSKIDSSILSARHTPAMYDPLTHTYTYTIDDYINQTTENQVKELLSKMSTTDIAVITIDSHGGMAVSGTNIADMLIMTNKHVVLKCTGMAASAAAVVLLAGKERVVSPSAMVIFHEPYLNSDNTGDLKTRSFELNKIQLEYLNQNFDFQNKIGRNHFTTYAIGGDLILLGSEFNQLFGK